MKARELLDKKWAQAFHQAAEQLLFTGIRFSKDSQEEIAYVTMKVQNTDEYDWKKPRRLIGYLKQTIKLSIILIADGMKMIKKWMDASYATHNIIHGHTGGTTSMGKNGWGLIIRKSKKQKLNKKIDREITHWGGQRDDTDATDKLFIVSTMKWYQQEHIIPRQYEHDDAGK